jgi:hypothetical protein
MLLSDVSPASSIAVNLSDDVSQADESTYLLE